MPELITSPPYSRIDPVTDILHGVPVTDPYRWLESQDSPQTREWIEEQTRYARGYLDSIPGRDRIRRRVREFLAAETHDSLQKAGTRYFFRKRSPDREQACIFMREGADGEDRLLIDPSLRGTGAHTAVKPLHISPNGQLLLYEVKIGGERTGTFELLDIKSRCRQPDVLPRGYLHGFAFAPDSKSFYYVHEALDAKELSRRAYHHILGTQGNNDQEIFCAEEDALVHLHVVSDTTGLGILVYKFRDRTYTDFYFKRFDSAGPPDLVLSDAIYSVSPMPVSGRILAVTDYEAPNFRIVELRPRKGQQAELVDIIPQGEARIRQCLVTAKRLYVEYRHGTKTLIRIFSLSGELVADVPVRDNETVRLIGASHVDDELLLESESFTDPITLFRYSSDSSKFTLWAKPDIPFAPSDFAHTQIWYPSKDGTTVPMFLLGRRDVLQRECQPTIMTSYGGFGISMTPQFSVFVAFMVEHGCLFALPNIRGGSEFGAQWHEAAKRRNRQTAYDDFLSAAQWLIDSGKTNPKKLAIFGGSNSGLLVGAAMVQRPEMFRAVVCLAPILDMLRYHLFDHAVVWRDEFGTAEDRDDFYALLDYSPYYGVKDGVEYPATMFISGDADRTCNPLHARKMTARLQTANLSRHPIFLDYNKFRGHSPVLPLSERIEALTDRMAFLCDQLELAV